MLTTAACRNFLEETIFGSSSLPNLEISKMDVGLVGIELEVFPFQILKDSKVAPIQFKSYKDLLIKIAAGFEGVPVYEEEDTDLLKKIEFPNGDNFQFEPGGQIEIIINPCQHLVELESRIDFMQSILSEITKIQGIQFAQHGTNPWFGTNEINLQVPKQRYINLQNYLDKISPFGRMMMRLTGSLQINLDLGNDEKTRVKRIIATNLLSPLATALFANSSVTSGTKNDLKAYRSFIWQKLDPKRTGILPLEKICESFKKEEVIEEYLNFSLNAPLIYIEKDPLYDTPLEFTFKDWLSQDLNGHHPDISDFANHLSLLFPEVRLRKYIELRSVDAPPKEWQMVPVYFYTGLLYESSFLEKTLDILIPVKEDIENMARKATNGFLSEELYLLSKQIMKLSIEGFKALPSSFKDENQTDKLISFYENYTSKRRCFADDSIDFFKKNKSITY